MELSPVDLERLCAIISERSGVALPESRWAFVQSRAGAVMARARLTSGKDLIGRLEASSEHSGRLYADLEEALWVHETSFFRYESHHRILHEMALPAILGGEDRQTPVRILSAGCSTGEEPYSIAMTAGEAGADLRDFEILGIDASREALAFAQHAIYPAKSLASVPREYIRRYFVKGPEADTFAVTSACRSAVRFLRHNIRTASYLGKFDAIFCCNVLLYFTPAVKDQILTWLAASLHRGGWLFLGHADGVTPPEQWFREGHLPAGFVYQRT